MKLKQIFKDCRIVGLAGCKNSGKTNNLVSLIEDLREDDKKLAVYAYGMPIQVMKYLHKLGVREISSLRHLVGKKNCILIIDEFQKLKLNDRKFRDELNEFVDFVYHDNVYVILSTPNIREFNSVIGGVIEKWLLKDVRIDQCINGSQLKKAIDSYKGKHKSLKSISVPKDTILIINDVEEVTIKCPYVKAADHKLKNEELF